MLDTFSIIEKKKSLEGLHIGIVGDVLHSRVARSDIMAFKKLGARVTLCGPTTLVPDEFRQFGVEICHSIDEVLSDLDVINLLRIQNVITSYSIHYTKLYEIWN